MRRLALPLAVTLLAGLAGAGYAATPAAPRPAARAAVQPPPGMPAGVPPAALHPEPVLPSPPPSAWPFGEQFPRTSGTGRLAGGASFWTDFLYDDHGAAGIQVAAPVSSLAPTAGTYVYPAGPAAGDGADIFRAAVGYAGHATYWRVDWVTLENPDVPIAEWTIDSDRNSTTGVSAWAAGAGVVSPGIDHAIVVSAKETQVIDLLTGKTVAVLPTQVSKAARSFVVRIPTSVLPVSGTARVRLAAGLANPAGTAFATVPPSDGAAPGQPNVYNVTFRSVAQEPMQFGHGIVPNYVTANNAASLANTGNFWAEDDQAQTLASGNVSKFSLDVSWAQLARRVGTPEPLVYGYSDRWYPSWLNLGQGVQPLAAGATYGKANYLSRVQPYAVYVPRSYRPGEPTPLTWILHSLQVNYNQYGALDPQQIQQECEDRHSICASPEGFGPAGWYFGPAEVDFWSVWRDVARHFTLDPQRTVISGYSMGGYATYKLGLTYPDLFAGAIALAGPPVCGMRVYGPVEGGAGSGRCTADGDTLPLVGNATWLPYAMDDGVADELVPITGVLEQEQAFLTAGERIHAQVYPAEDHLFYATQDAFGEAIASIGTPVRVTNPPRIDYTFYPDLVDPALGVGPVGDYWITHVAGRSATPGTLAHVVATDAAIPDPAVTPVQSESVEPTANPSPALLIQQTWRLGKAPATAARLVLRLTDVGALTVDTARARLPHGVATVTSDGPVTLTLTGVGTFHLKAGTTHLRW